MIGFDDLDTLDGGEEPRRTSNSEIRKNAHVVNGGEATFSCTSCKGSGKFISYSGRVVGDCFKCKGKGRVTSRQLAAQKAAQTRKQNDARWEQDHAAEIAYMRRASEGGFRLMGNLLEKLQQNGRLNADDMNRVREYKQKDDDRNALRELQRAEEKAQREASAPVVELSAIDKLFATATDNQIKRPIFRAETLELSKAGQHSRNPGALYVTRRDEQGTYLGMLKDGKFIARREATQGDIDALMAIAADPTAEAIKYARRTGRCGCCGKQLVNPVSILAAVGPICASKWGLDFRRELAETEYAQMKADEIAKIKE